MFDIRKPVRRNSDNGIHNTIQRQHLLVLVY